MIPRRCFAVLDGEAEPCWWTSTDERWFERRSGDRREVSIHELTWVAHGLSDRNLEGAFRKKVLYEISVRESERGVRGRVRTT